MSTNVAPAGRTRRVIFLCLVVFIGFVGHSLMVTIFTPMLLTTGHGYLPAGATAAQRTFVLGLLLALYPLGQVLGSPVQGVLSDRYGRKPVLVFTLCLTASCYALIILSLTVESLLLLGIARLIAGLSEANVVMAQSAIADMTDKEERGRLFGYMYMSISLAYVLGPLAGGKLSDPGLVSWFSYATPFWLVLALLAATIYWCAIDFQETHLPRPRIGCLNSITNLLTVFADARLRWIYRANFLVYLTVAGYFRPMYLVSEFNMGVSKLSEYIAYAQLPLVVANLGFVGFLTRRFSYKALTMYFALLAAVFMTAVVLFRSRLWLFFTLPGAATAIAVCLPSCAALLSSEVEEAEQGRVMGSNQSLQLGAQFVAGLLAGVLAGISASLPLLLLAFGGIGAALILNRSSIPSSP
jgi:MFS family permease